jgi:hypothetical protein
MPEFHADEPAHQDWKRKVLAGEVKLDEIDTTPFKDRFRPGMITVKPSAATAAE